MARSRKERGLLLNQEVADRRMWSPQRMFRGEKRNGNSMLGKGEGNTALIATLRVRAENEGRANSINFRNVVSERQGKSHIVLAANQNGGGKEKGGGRNGD